MASICRQKRRRFYYARYRDGQGVQRLVSTKIEHTPDAPSPKERAAKAAENRRIAQEIANRYEEAERGSGTEQHLRKVLADISERLTTRRIDFPSARDYLTQWLQSRRLAEGTRARYLTPFLAFIDSMGNRADLPITEVSPADIDKFSRGRLALGIGSSTVATDLKALNVPFKAAARAGLIPWNPVARAEPVESAKESRLPFTREEVEALIESTRDTDWCNLIHLAAFAGLRLGDAANLKWSAVDLFAGTLDFRPKKTERQKRDLLLPLSPRLKAHLVDVLPAEGAAGFISPALAGRTTGGNKGLSQAFSRIMERAGIEQKSIGAEGRGRRFNKKSFHSFRHFFISELERQGVAPDLRKKLAGHLDDRSHGRYTHTELSTLQKAVASL